MAIKTSQSINGFIAADPRLSFNEDGKARLYVRVGINHWDPQPNGSFRKLEPTYHDLVQFGKGAERSHERFRKGDDFVAQGYVREYTRVVDGHERSDERFVAKRLAHDPNTTTYEVHRRPPANDRDNVDRAEPQAERDPTVGPSPAPANTQMAAQRPPSPEEAASAPPPPPTTAETVTR